MVTSSRKKRIIPTLSASANPTPHLTADQTETRPGPTFPNFLSQINPRANGPAIREEHRYSSQARSIRKQRGSISYERSGTHRCFAIYIFNPCLRAFLTWDK